MHFVVGWEGLLRSVPRSMFSSNERLATALLAWRELTAFDNTGLCAGWRNNYALGSGNTICILSHTQWLR